MDLPTMKLHKIIDSAQRAINNLQQDNKLGAVGDIHFIQENCQEILYILADEIKNEKED